MSFKPMYPDSQEFEDYRTLVTTMPTVMTFAQFLEIGSYTEIEPEETDHDKQPSKKTTAKPASHASSQ